MVVVDYTNIRITKKTAEKLRNVGKKGQTYEEIIREILDITQS